ncbi:MAG TPA: hypothetical protein VM934_07590 [Pyrinomonadaceae bacterium]|jgi:hypothetical protein|nr:hypothetical protein [Pyrinomonadaceae bacterium]
MGTTEGTNKLELVYTILCDDVRLEMGNKLSLMGVFHQLVVQQFPVSFMKFAVVNQWRGEGTYLSEVRILTEDGQQPIVLSQPAPFEVAPGGVANNISFFFDVVFPAAGQYRVQTLVDSSLFDERILTLAAVGATAAQLQDAASEAVN